MSPGDKFSETAGLPAEDLFRLVQFVMTEGKSDPRLIPAYSQFIVAGTLETTCSNYQASIEIDPQ